MEESLIAGAGLLVSREKELLQTFKILECNLMGERKYCRIVEVPALKGGLVERFLKSEVSLGELVLCIPKCLFHAFRHRIDFFRQGYTPIDFELEEISGEATYPEEVLVVIWANQKYRESHKQPRDIEECFLLWAAQCFHNCEIVVLDAFRRLFPSNIPSMVSKEYTFVNTG